MSEQELRKRRVSYTAPDGKEITLADLPSPGTRRWVARRKAAIVMAVQHGLISFEEACARYSLTLDEYLSWQRSFERHGIPGLRATRVDRDHD